MCDGHRHLFDSQALQNLRQPMPLDRKIKLVVRNVWIRIRTRSSCCGHYGEPGC
jgi:hypothetical protein